MKAFPLEKINLKQLFILIIQFEIGSAVVVGIGVEAGRDAWIAVLLGTLAGMALIWMYTYILSLQQDRNYFEITELVLGRAMAVVLTSLYALYFIYIASRVLRDFTELLVTDTYPNTPIEVLSVTFMLMVCYVVYLGVEVIARTTEMLTPYVIGLLSLICIFLFAGQNIQADNLKPLLAEGIEPLGAALFPGLLGFPFGETIVFLVIMAYTKCDRRVLTAVGAVALSGCILAFYSFITIAVLGTEFAKRSAFPLLNATREISMANFIERLDSFIVFVMMIGIFVKVSLFIYGALKAMEYLFKIPFRYFAFPITMVIALTTIIIASNYAEHIEEGLKFVPLYLHMPLQYVIPSVIFLFVLYRKMRQRGRIEHARQ